MEDKFKDWVLKQLESELPSADVERAMDYADDLLHGLKTFRTYPQGVVVYGSARVKPNDKYAVKARELGGFQLKRRRLHYNMSDHLYLC